ncbi:C40 family peptidase [Mycetocola sp.]|jgi:cell wall-associated NlpC family hydrolase|uniref:C40 family peptidase n=1 Tax=Mycetocola sp. TaxID=1871042 RepID=UPI0026042468|nr:C40 family peptidase [Mycetocola sp.]MCU1560889.1 Cell wall-associated hydrolase, NlpC family [Mycetocola sp.]
MSSTTSGWRAWRSTAIMALVVPGLFATMALPAYAFTPETDAAGTASLQSLKESGAQSLSVGTSITANAVARDGYSATTEEELAAANAAAAAAAAKAAADAASAEAAAKAAADAASQRAAFTNTQNKFSGPSAEDLAKAPPYPNFSLAQVYSVALQYQGVPYVYGGATPAGFDCSGFVKYVYAQFGVSMPHSSTAQGNMGKRISIQDAVPGDLIVSDGHIGFYAGDNKILHASRPGTPLRIGPIYADNWWVVRIGI